MQKPEITVFMAVYNGEKFIKEAIDSVLQQSFKNFELLIVDDGSTDSSLSIINSYTDKRIRLLKNDRNKGLAFTRNRGIEEADGKYFATLDCDDVAYKYRLENQLDYFLQNKSIVLCGGRIKFINEQSKIIGQFASLKGGGDFLKSLLLFNNIYCNSTTMLHTSILKKFCYESSFAPAEDYELFAKVSMDYKIGFINKFLCKYRVHETNISSIKSDKRINAEKIIAERQLQHYGFNYTQNELELHTKFTSTRFDFINEHLYEYVNWFNNLVTQNKVKKIFHESLFRQALARQWLRICFYQLKTKHSIAPFFNKGQLTYSDLFISLIKSI